MIYINGEVATSITAKSGDFVQGYVLANNLISTPRPVIEGDNVTDYIIQNIDPFTSFEFGFSVGRLQEDTKVTFSYTLDDKTRETEELTLQIDDVHENGYILFANRTNLSVQGNMSANGLSLTNALFTNELATPITVESSAEWLRGVVVGDNLNVTIGKNSTTQERSATLTLTAKDNNGRTVTARNIIIQYAANSEQPSSFYISTDRMSIPSIVFEGDGAFAVEWQPAAINVTAVNVGRWEATTDADFFTVSQSDDSITIGGLTNNETPNQLIGTINVVAYGNDEVVYNKEITIVQEPSTSHGTIELIGGSNYNLTPNANATAEVVMQLKNVFENTVSLSYDRTYDEYLNIVKFGNSFIISSIYNNDTIDDKVYHFTVNGIDYANTQVSVQFTITHKATTNADEFPIWDYKVIRYNTSNEYIDYQLVLMDGTTIYNGRAYAKDNIVEIELNSILKHYLIENINIDFEGWQDNNGYVVARLIIDNDEYKIYNAYNDWSYEVNDDKLISYPISNVLDYRQRFYVSAINKLRSEGIPTVVDVKVDGISDQEPQVINNQIMTKSIMDLSNVSTIDVTTDGETLTYNVRCTNMPYAIYYLNKCGGYDSMLFNGASLKSSTIKNSEYSINEYNRHLHSLKQYEKQIVQQWQLKSAILNDKQSELMNHLLTSPQMWLHDLNKDEIIPVIITDTTAQYKLRSNQNRKPIQYSLTVKSSKTHYRR